MAGSYVELEIFRTGVELPVCHESWNINRKAMNYSGMFDKPSISVQTI